jgi:hypothetical protein
MRMPLHLLLFQHMTEQEPFHHRVVLLPQRELGLLRVMQLQELQHLREL